MFSSSLTKLSYKLGSMLLQNIFLLFGLANSCDPIKASKLKKVISNEKKALAQGKENINQHNDDKEIEKESLKRQVNALEEKLAAIEASLIVAFEGRFNALKAQIDKVEAQDDSTVIYRQEIIKDIATENKVNEQGKKIDKIMDALHRRPRLKSYSIDSQQFETSITPIAPWQPRSKSTTPNRRGYGENDGG